MNLEQKINDLKKQVGKPYEMFWENSENLYQGCFYPIYAIYPHLPKYPLFADNMADNWDYGIDLIQKHAYEIDKSEVRLGDVMVTRFRKELHVAICLGGGKIIHVFKDHTLEISRIQNYFKDRLIKYYRVKNA
jgi:hypothetical protein